VGRVRYCDLCKKNVHALDQYSLEERGALWRESGGHVCGMLVGGSAEPVRSRRMILLGALLTAVSPLLAQSGRLRIRVTDITGAVVPGANLSIPGTMITAITNESGEAVLTGVPLREFVISLNAPGFKSLERTVTILGGGEQKLEATLEIGSTLGEVVLVTPSANVVPTGFMPSPHTLDLPSPQPQDLRSLPTLIQPPEHPAKRHWWQIFR
jgi:hypothetical protein